jgi:hypothetical protein
MSGVLSIVITVILVLSDTGLSRWISFLIAFISLTAMGLIPLDVFIPLAKVTQERKAARDDALYDIACTDGQPRSNEHLIFYLKER